MKHNLHLVEGGIGKHLQFTSLFDSLKKKYNEDLSIMAGWSGLFKMDPRVAHVADMQILPLHDWSAKSFNNYNNIICNDPYRGNFLKGGKHIITSWAEMYDIKVNDTRPNFFINEKRENILKTEILKLGKFILVQFTGGQGLVQQNYDNTNMGRNYNKGQQLINYLKEAMPDLNIVVFGHTNEQEPLLNTTSGFYDKEDFMILSKYCTSFICIDSSLQHMCSNKRFNKKGIVLWGTSNPLMFGYKNNLNIESEYPYCVNIEPKKIIDLFLNLELENEV
tara:strand:- start:1220 stop:2053 length:834 start_codon:yes stop_codon:yes gene_type:complete